MKNVLFAAACAISASVFMPMGAFAHQTCINLPDLDAVYTKAVTEADAAMYTAIDAADKTLTQNRDEADKLLESVHTLRDAFKASDSEGYVEFLKAEDEGSLIDPSTMSPAFQAFAKERSTAYGAWNKAKDAAYREWSDAKTVAYKENNDVKAKAMDELEKRQLQK